MPEEKKPAVRKIAGACQRGGWWHMDKVIDGVRYREPLKTKDWREVSGLISERTAAIKAGKAASPAGKVFARLTLQEAVEVFKGERVGKVAERTTQLDRERSVHLIQYFKARPIRTIRPGDVAAYQQDRIAKLARARGRTVAQAIACGSGRTVNMETTILRQILKKAKMYNVLADWPMSFPEHEREVGKVLEADALRHLFRVARDGKENARRKENAAKRAGGADWFAAYYAAVLASNTTCRGVELKNTQWKHVDLFRGVLTVARTKGRTAGRREIELTPDAKAAFVALRARAVSICGGEPEPEHFVFPACEGRKFDPERPQKSWRTAWRALTKEAAIQAGRRAAIDSLVQFHSVSRAVRAWKRAAAPYQGLRFHDLRHQAISELGESGAPDAVIQALAGHTSKKMQDKYSHPRRTAKRDAIAKLQRGLLVPDPAPGAQTSASN